ncbi:MAG: hypothetical protein ACP5N1_04700 [Candidatus Woesearchaeota archaeon]
MIENQIQEELTKIREGLYKVSLDEYTRLNKKPWLNNLSEDINNYKEKTGLFYKIVTPNNYKYALKEIDRLTKLDYLWKKEKNLISIIMSETSKDISVAQINKLRTNIESLEAEYLLTPQFKNSLYPSLAVYELKFQFPDFVNSELKPLLDAPAKDIKWLKTGINQQFNCLVKYAKNHRLIAEKVLEKIVEVYRLNKGSNKISYALFSVGLVKLENDALSGVRTLGKALGYDEEQINQKVI